MSKILLNHLHELVALEARMDEDSPGMPRVRARIEEVREALKGMPDGTITAGELHTVFRDVYDNAPVGAQHVANTLDSTVTRAGNMLRQLEDAGIVTTDVAGAWTTNLTPEEADAAFHKAFPGLTTTKPNTPRPKGAQPNKEKAMATTVEFTQDKSKITGTKFEQVVKMIDTLRKSKDPIGFTDLCDKVGAKYPQDVQAAMFALESVGAVDRYSYVEEGSTRSRIAYKWVATEDSTTPRPTKSPSTAGRKRSSGSKTKEATPAAA